MKIITLMLAVAIAATSCKKEKNSNPSLTAIASSTNENSCVCVDPHVRQSDTSPNTWIVSASLYGNTVFDTSYLLIKWEVIRRKTVFGITRRDTVTYSHTLSVPPQTTYEVEIGPSTSLRTESYLPNSVRLESGSTSNPYVVFYEVGSPYCTSGGGGYGYKKRPI